jgi:hypothetical protein
MARPGAMVDVLVQPNEGHQINVTPFISNCHLASRITHQVGCLLHSIRFAPSRVTVRAELVDA